jgi:succinate dehydrogenase hydrophobic anchor subunit
MSLFHWEAGITAIVMVFFTMLLLRMLGKKSYKEYALVSIGQKIAQIALSLLLYF